jgi:hypothetical protein
MAVGIEHQIAIPVAGKADLVEAAMLEYTISAARAGRNAFIWGRLGWLGLGPRQIITTTSSKNPANKS